ncbi:MAG: GNAT family N-acetyltransferase [Cyclobacteriaceae bacterium]|nr:GNAT family N-acetyltransferase [Cyclobacteriaceae bacterium]
MKAITHQSKDNRTFIVRKPIEQDAAGIISYSKVLFKSTDQVLTTVEEYTITIENEKIWIKTLNDNPRSHVLVAELDNQIVGLLFFMPNTKIKNAHTGEFGVSVHPDFQGIGIGRALIQALLDWAKGNESIEKVYLNVFATNEHAIKLYKDLGFVEEGRHVKAIKQVTGEYLDIVQMYVEVR